MIKGRPRRVVEIHSSRDRPEVRSIDECHRHFLDGFHHRIKKKKLTGEFEDKHGARRRNEPIAGRWTAQEPELSSGPRVRHCAEEVREQQTVPVRVGTTVSASSTVVDR